MSSILPPKKSNISLLPAVYGNGWSSILQHHSHIGKFWVPFPIYIHLVLPKILAQFLQVGVNNTIMSSVITIRRYCSVVFFLRGNCLLESTVPDPYCIIGRYNFLDKRAGAFKKELPLLWRQILLIKIGEIKFSPSNNHLIFGLWLYMWIAHSRSI